MTYLLLITKLSTKLFQILCRCYPHLSYINLDITFYTLTLALSRAEVLCVLQSQGQAAYLIAGLQEKTTYRSAPFLFGGDRARDALQWKTTRGATSEVVKETASWTRLDLTLRTLISASTRPLLCERGPLFLYGRGPSSLCGGDGRKSRYNSRWSSGFTQIDFNG